MRFFFFLFGVVYFLFNNKVNACDCIRGSVSFAVMNSDLILEGKIISREIYNFSDSTRFFQHPEDPDYNHPRYMSKSIAKYKFVVGELLKKGASGDTITIFTELSLSQCGFVFDTGQHYIVYLKEIHPVKIGSRNYFPFTIHKNDYATSNCGTRNVLFNQEEIEEVKKHLQIKNKNVRSKTHSR